MKHERPEEFPEIQDRTWVPILKEICDHKVPEARRISLAKKVLRSDYVQAWVEVMEEYRRLEPDTRWGVKNWLEQVSGPIRLKALKILNGHPGPRNGHWQAAIAALALCCKGKDLPMLLRMCRLGISGEYEDIDTDIIGDCLSRITSHRPDDDYTELLDLIAEHLWQADLYWRKVFFDQLLDVKDPRAEEMLLAAIQNVKQGYWELLGEFYLFQKNKPYYLERAQSVLSTYQPLAERMLRAEDYYDQQIYNVWSYLEIVIRDFLEEEEEEEVEEN